MIQYGETSNTPAIETIEGTIMTVGSRGVITLDDGMKLTIPATIPKDQLTPGAMIIAEYERQGRRKVATSVQIKS